MRKIRNMVIAVCLILQVAVALVFGFSQMELPSTVYLVCWCVLGGIICLSSDSKKVI